MSVLHSGVLHSGVVSGILSTSLNFLVDIKGPALAFLHVLSFEGGTRRNIPKFEVGTLIYVRVVKANTGMNPELSCTDGWFSFWTSNSILYMASMCCLLFTSTGKVAEYGPLKDGFTFESSTGLARMLLSSPTCPVLEGLGKKLSFEIAVGLNGRVWVRARIEVDVLNFLKILNSSTPTISYFFEIQEQGFPAKPRHTESFPFSEADKIAWLLGQPFVGFQQFSGYVTVDDKKQKSLFYYFVEAEFDPFSKPLVLWLNGGPGCSSLGVGAFSENGPFRPNRQVLVKNEYSWNREANMLYLETPVGVGFSYSTDASSYEAVSDQQTGITLCSCKDGSSSSPNTCIGICSSQEKAMQILCLIAMEKPISLTPEHIRDEKVKDIVQLIYIGMSSALLTLQCQYSSPSI
ncbi:hypothetical protein TEA_005589 [Camellia sinensis var. sinensis]|uniref:K Homology domain-containing protein n=1 Tax=Camellia sinensis var. sinensis TaxID=542762 RepID=A0A4S4EJ22_CAMSN|nr:hypothetical protein TEA_005589 [Camellia sinensis var. sinensis]